MLIEILTPDKKIFEGEIESAKLPGSMGAFEVLKGHAPLISTLKKGAVIVSAKGIKTEFPIEGGVAEVLKNKIIVLAEG